MATNRLTPTGTVWCLMYTDEDGNEGLSSVHASEESANVALDETSRTPGHSIVAWSLLDVKGKGAVLVPRAPLIAVMDALADVALARGEHHEGLDELLRMVPFSGRPMSNAPKDG